MQGALTGKAALVTAAGNGIGRAAARAVARYGAGVIVSDIDADAAARVAGEIVASGGTAHAIRTDVTVEADVVALVAFAVEKLGGLDCAINNAGIANAPQAFTDIAAEEWRRVVELTLNGAWTCMRHELPAMVARGGGAIVNTASNAGKFAVPTMAPYGAAKAGVISITQTCAIEYADRGIRVNAVCPGVIMTGPILALKEQGIDFAKQLSIPMGRPGEAEEVGELMAWLASPLASYVTGQAISIDGGMSASQ